MKGWLECLERRWFAPSERFDLGFFRILFGLWLLYTWFARLEPRLTAAVARPAELALPPALLRWAGLPVPVPELVVDVARFGFPLLALLVTAGLLLRWALPLATVLFLYFEGSHNAWGYTSHSTVLPALLLVILCFAPGVDSFSLDRRRAPTSGHGAPSAWPVRLCLVLLALLYFASGVSKLRYAGLAWLDGETLAFYLSGGSPRGTGSMQRFIADPSLPPAARFRDGFALVDYAWVADPPALARSLAEHSWLMKLASGAVLALELSFPLALLGRRPMFAYLALGAAFHLGVQLLMRIDFAAYLLTYGLFVDWRRLGRGFRMVLARRKPEEKQP